MVTSLGRNNGSRRQQKRQNGEREQRRAKIIKGLEKKKKKKEKRKKSTRYQVPGKKVPGLRMAHYDSYVPNREHTVSSERRMRREGGGILCRTGTELLCNVSVLSSQIKPFFLFFQYKLQCNNTTHYKYGISTPSIRPDFPSHVQ